MPDPLDSLAPLPPSLDAPDLPDLIPDAAEAMRATQESVLAEMRGWGYQLVATPTLERVELCRDDVRLQLGRLGLDHRGVGRGWKSGWQTIARIDESKKTWYAACRIPLKSVSEKEIKPGTKWRANLYRIDGEGPDSQRRFMCWQPTCVLNRDPNHVPENFGTLVFTK